MMMDESGVAGLNTWGARYEMPLKGSKEDILLERCMDMLESTSP